MSSLEGFAFCYLPFQEGDVGMVLSNGNDYSIWYLATTQEFNSRVISWTLKPVSRYHRWKDWTMTLINDIVSDASQAIQI